MPDRVDSTPFCEECADSLAVTGVGIMLMTGVDHRGVLCSSDATSGTVEELQFTLGEGPCVDACEYGTPVHEPDLRAPHVPRWPAFTPPAIHAGVRAIFGFPLQVGSVRLGALDVYNDQPGPLRPHQVSEAIELAAVVTRRVLELQADAEPGGLAPELAGPEILRATVHQASGMLSARLDISVDEAMLRIRAHAFATERAIDDVAKDVIGDRLKIE